MQLRLPRRLAIGASSRATARRLARSGVLVGACLFAGCLAAPTLGPSPRWRTNALRPRTETQKGQLNELEQRLAIATADLEAARREASELRERLAATETRVASLSRDLEAEAGQLERRRAELARIEGRVDLLNRQREAFQDEALRLVSVLRAADARVQEQARTIAANSTNVGDLSARVAELGRFTPRALVPFAGAHLERACSSKDLAYLVVQPPALCME